MNRALIISLVIFALAILMFCYLSVKSNKKGAYANFEIADIEKITSVVAKSARGEKKLTSNQIVEFKKFLSNSQYTQFPENRIPVFKSSNYDVELSLNDGRKYNSLYVDGCSRIIVGSAQFKTTRGDCFDFGIEHD